MLPQSRKKLSLPKHQIIGHSRQEDARSKGTGRSTKIETDDSLESDHYFLELSVIATSNIRDCYSIFGSRCSSVNESLSRLLGLKLG